jgi:hypothetical protein
LYLKVIKLQNFVLRTFVVTNLQLYKILTVRLEVVAPSF